MILLRGREEALPIHQFTFFVQGYTNTRGPCKVGSGLGRGNALKVTKGDKKSIANNFTAKNIK